MKVLNLRCGEGHAFEGWFGSEDDFQSQATRGLIECPLCADTAIEKRPSAPRLNVGNLREATPAPLLVQAKDRWLHHVRRLIASTEDVGERFPEEARRIHYGETAERAIRGQASHAESEALRDEGIEIVSVSIPPALKEPLQ
ncbi:MAG: DUF1178 family protein [Burkholderiaceae bacterium]